MHWLFFAFINILGSTLNNVFIKLTAGKVSSLLGALLVYIGGALTITALFPFLKEKVVFEKQGVIFSLIAGAALGVGTIAWFKMYRLGAPISLATVIVLLSIILLSTAFGIILFHERLTPKFIAGLSFAIVALYLLTTSAK